MTRSTFANPVPLPVFINDQRMAFDVWANGCILGEHSYDGWTNKIEVTPLVTVPGVLLPTVEVGQSYTIGERHLARLVLGAGDVCRG